MGCTSEKSVPINMIKKYSDISDNEINIDLHDIEKQGESKHPKIEEKNLENIEIEENNYYNYNLDELISVNTSKMRVKRIENFDDDDESDNDESSNESVEENKSIETDEKENINNHIDENEKKMIENNSTDKNKMNMTKSRENKKPEDKKPPNIEKLKKKGKEKIEINLFN